VNDLDVGARAIKGGLEDCIKVLSIVSYCRAIASAAPCWYQLKTGQSAAEQQSTGSKQ
jgi:hypothetical protein